MAEPTEDSMSAPDHPQVGAKSFDVKFKTDDLADGEFIAYASVFDSKDSDGDTIVKGAYANTLKKWAEKGKPIPLLWGHNTSDPDFNVGHIVSAKEDDRGLKVHGMIDMESPKGPQTYRLLKSGRVDNMSFAYSVIDGSYSSEKSAYELRELDLFEVSIVPIGANQETEILAVKSAVQSLSAKAGRVLSAKNEDAIRGVITELKSAAESLQGVLPADPVDEEDQDQTSGKEPPPETAKSSGEATLSPSVSLALTEITLASLGDVA